MIWAVGLPKKSPISSLMQIGNTTFWSYLQSIGIGFQHHVRPLKSLAQLEVGCGAWHPSQSFRLRAWMCTVKFLLGVMVWELKWERRSFEMVEPMWSMLCQICKLLPNYFSLYVTSFFSLEVNFGMVPIKHVFALLGYLDCGVLWGRLGIDVPDLNRIRDSGLDLLPFNYVLFAVCRFADRSIDCKELVISWVDVIANMIDVGGFGGKLVTSIPQLPLPGEFSGQH